MAKPKVLVIQTGGTVGQERDEAGEFQPSDRDYLPIINGINQVEGQDLKSTPEKVVIDKLRKYTLIKSYTFPSIDIHAIQTENIDSTKMEEKDRATIANRLYENAHDYDGFVIIHGTDTMADTAAALSLMIQGLRKPIILTGPQTSIYEPGSDAHLNIVKSIQAATTDIGEVAISFGDRIIRGNRATKVSEQGLIAFNSPRLPPIGEIGIDIMLKDHRYVRGKGEDDPTLFTDFETSVEYYEPSSLTN